MRVAICEDSALFREGLSRLLAEAGFTVVAAVEDAESLLDGIGADPPDVVVMDIRLPPTFTDEGLRAAATLMSRHPGVGVLVLSQHVRVSYAVELLGGRTRGVGYLLKDRVSDLAEFAAAIRRVGEGGSALDPVVVEQLVGRHSGLPQLTEREREVLRLMAEGRTNKAISELLRIAERTVEKHCTGIFGKLGLESGPHDHRRVLAVLQFLRYG